jgi:NifU-like protein involved in Fe-S cluster formation
MVQEALRRVLQAADGAGVCEGPGAASGTAEHPVCGDVVELSVRLDQGRVTDLRWRARGCPASMAVAALAHRALVGAAAADAEATLRRAIAAHGDLARHERHAEALVLRAFRAAVGV